MQKDDKKIKCHFETIKYRYKSREFVEDGYKVKFFDLADELYYINYLKDDKVIYNKAWTKQLGWSEEELIERHVEGLIYEDDKALAYAKIDAASKGEYVGGFVLRVVAKNGDVREYYFHGYGDKDNRIAYAIGIDVTQEIKLKQILQKEQQTLNHARVTMMGEMVSAMAHHWRQPLAAVSLGFDMIVSDFEDGMLTLEGLKKEIAGHKAVLSSMSKSIDNLSGFFNYDKQKLSTPQESLDSVLKLMPPFATPIRITLKTSGFMDFEPMGISTSSDTKQILWTLLSNAKDAIAAKHIENPLFDGEITVYFDKTADFETITVEDNGIGIEKGIEDRIFEPFFTTKERGQGKGVIHGKGLGLCTLKTIVTAKLNGDVEVYTKEGKTVAKVNIPLKTNG